MATHLDLLKAVRAGRLQDVIQALDSGAELDDPQDGEPGLLLGMACFLGHADIVTELVKRGAQVNLTDNTLPTSPLSMAVRGKRNEVVRTLIQLGVQVPDGMVTGLSEHEIMLAKWIAFRDGYSQEGAPNEPVFDEIVLLGRSDTDTQVLEAEALRAIEAMR
jgi:uncharacterized protein